VNRNTNVNRNVNRNTNVNIDRDRDVDIDIDVDHRHGGCCYHPIATAAAVTHGGGRDGGRSSGPR